MNHGKRDANHAAIKDALKAVGCSVLDLADVGRGCPDLLVGYAGHNWLMEVKDGANKTLTEDESRFALLWRGQCAIVRTVDEALMVIGMRGK